MPKLLAFVPCERVLTDQGNNVSIISILSNVAVSVQVPENAAIPLHWEIFSLWQQEADDAGKTLEQYCELRDPDGRAVLKSVLEFQVTAPSQRNVVTVIGFPIAPRGGEYALVLFLRETNGERKELATFPIIVVVTPTT